LTPSTVAMRLSAIERLYAFAGQLSGRDSLDAVIARTEPGLPERYVPGRPAAPPADGVYLASPLVACPHLEAIYEEFEGLL